MLVLHLQNLVFRERHNANLGWCIVNLYHHNHQLVAVFSEKFKSNGTYDDGPNDTYAYGLVNGIEAAVSEFTRYIMDATTLPVEHQRLPDVLLHFTPPRNLPSRSRRDPTYEAEYAQLTLAWHTRERYAVQQGNVHPWTPITSAQFTALIGCPPEDIPVT